jgi:hypothetical protein
MRRTILAAALALAGACGDSSGGPGAPDAGPNPTPDAMVPSPDAAPQGIMLQTWVEQLVTERTSDTAEPDTVEDKVIIDTEDPNAFDRWIFPTQ